MEFGDRLKEFRLAKGLTQEELAKQIGVAKTTLTGYEKGNREPDVFKIKKLAEVLGVTGDDLLGTKDLIKQDDKEWSRNLDRAYAAASHDTQVGVCKILDIAHVKVPAPRQNIGKAPYIPGEAQNLTPFPLSAYPDPDPEEAAMRATLDEVIARHLAGLDQPDVK